MRTIRKTLRLVTAGILIALVAGMNNAEAAPANDDAKDATTINSHPYVNTQDTTGAGIQSTEAQPSGCGQVGSTVWYKWTPLVASGAVADSFGSSFDSIMAVWELKKDQTIVQLTCNDDTAGPQSQVRFSAVTSSTYFFQIGGKNGATGFLKFTLNKPIDNDQVGDAIPVVGSPFVETQSTQGATIEANELLTCGISSTVWYRHNAVTDGNYFADTSGSNFDTVMAVYAIAPNGGVAFLGCNDNFIPSERYAGVRFGAASGWSYVFQVGGMSGTMGMLKFTFRTEGTPPDPTAELPQTPPIPPPLPPIPPTFPPAPPPIPSLKTPAPFNDDAVNAFPFTTAPFAHASTTYGATLEPFELTPCAEQIDATVWYRYTAPSNQALFVEASGSYKTIVAVWEEVVGRGFNLVGCSSPGLSGDSVVNFQGNKDSTYYFQIGGDTRANEIGQSGYSGALKVVLGRL